VSRSQEGRWALLPEREADVDPDELAEAVAEQLLARYGVVFRDLVWRESFAVPWRQVAWALRRLEARGQIRGGRFVNMAVTSSKFRGPMRGLTRDAVSAPPARSIQRKGNAKPENSEGGRKKGVARRRN
jgi:ATP-dependent Lhr-like helicase